ncbi:hypothetical protein [Acetobacter sp. P1H12_c]|uniref:hypothetical protein n=1 Tax=Acetobacter sp. P1H12_c TaxID=2762621 RepID=UPI00207B2C78|nr:hypothetical protein [Acetobacter sp. P1H12_c]
MHQARHQASFRRQSDPRGVQRPVQTGQMLFQINDLSRDGNTNFVNAFSEGKTPVKGRNHCFILIDETTIQEDNRHLLSFSKHQKTSKIKSKPSYFPANF